MKARWNFFCRRCKAAYDIRSNLIFVGTILPMRRILLHIAIAFLTFLGGVGVSRFLNGTLAGVTCEGSNPELLVFTLSSNMSRFISEGSLLEPDYHIYWYRTPDSNDPQQINLVGDFRSAEVTRWLFESNATPDNDTLIELGPKFDMFGREVGKRGVIVFNGGSPIRIFWTDGDVFWSVQAPTLQLAREFEQSDRAQSITTWNKGLDRTRR